MKKILTFILIVAFLFPLMGSTAFAQQEACLQATYGDKLKKESTNLYSYVTILNRKMWLWTSPSVSYMNFSDGSYGSWQCANNNVTYNKTGTLPACVQKLTTLTVQTNDPNGLQYDPTGFGKVSLWISNNRYQVVQTGQMGNWSCGSDGTIVLQGAIKPTTDKGDPQNTPPAVTDKGDAQNTPPQNSTNSNNQSTNAPLKIKLNNPLKVDTLQDAIKLFMDAVVKIAIPFIVVFFIWAGLRFILAQGKPEDIKKAKAMFWYTVIGTLLILGAWAITDAIVGTINSIAS